MVCSCENRVHDRYEHFYRLQMGSREDTVHIDRLKPAFRISDIANEHVDISAPGDEDFHVNQDDVFNVKHQSNYSENDLDFVNITDDDITILHPPGYDQNSTSSEQIGSKTIQPINESYAPSIGTSARHTDRRGRLFAISPRRQPSSR